MDEIKKQYYTIGEVAKILELPPSVIRFWETEFPQIQPRKNRKGNRIFIEKDLELLRKIKYLLRVQKYTIKGAKEFLAFDNQEIITELVIPPASDTPSDAPDIIATLKKMKIFLLYLQEKL